ncbi:putative peptidoglycan lipid II flippase MurJ [Cystobacter fuscus DSM 2262]|uniref:Probable lipid II flippase MurJ n=1 Tax=Cystobacter fuscus (strain ATCC 25194 / DSM 2262 / NBRC 100088 / M29) TaxID=1242864 RepID=S9Q4M8_CYSF2|nr:murein biosynthesis integral membrane protein MurJ [Cystobacter fuscus]EPX56294.1 putative peptidoglycan lipid II flippase MurJ [Cystobacter fuscus DSM 2262]
MTVPTPGPEAPVSSPPPRPAVQGRATKGSGALFVAAGILASRLVGLVRERFFAHYLGNGVAADVFKAAMRIPNFLQNLFGEGVLSGSFIPVYSGLLGKGDEKEADRVAGAVFGLLALVTGVLVALGLLATPLLVDTIALGFEGEARRVTIRLVRILFPGTGLLVMSAWCLGVLNSHRKFLLSYLAPVVWNLAIITTLVGAGMSELPEESLVVVLSYGVVVGCALQFLVQVPSVLRVLGHFRPHLSTASESVRQVLRSFSTVVLSRGVVQISAYVDTSYASLVAPRALSTLTYAQTLYLIPVSLFGMAISAAELPEMSRAAGAGEAVADKVRARLEAGARRVAFFVVPSAAALLFIGDVVAGALLQTGQLTAADTRYLWYVLMGSSVGLVASALGRLYASTFYALKDTRTPLRFATLRVVLGAALAWLLALRLPELLGLPTHLGTAFLPLSGGLMAWFEAQMLRRSLGAKIGPVPPPAGMAKLWGAAIAAGLTGLGIKVALTHLLGPSPRALAEWGGNVLPPPHLHPVLVFPLVVLPFGLVYFALTSALGVPEAKAVLQRVLRRKRAA